MLDQREQLLDLAPGEARRRLIKDQNCRLLRKRFADLQHLFLCHAQAADGPAQVEREAELIEHRPTSPFLALAVKETRQLADVFAPEEHIVNDVEIGSERKLLKDHGDTKRTRRCRIVDCDLDTAAIDGAAIGRLRSGNDFRQR